MSQIILASSISRFVSDVNSTVTHHILQHPALVLKSNSLLRFNYSKYASSVECSVSSHAHTNRITTNIARLYARRILEIASMSAATMVSKTSLEGAIIKPMEWSTVDLEQQRKAFGESISSLGKTKVERVWAAGSRILNLSLLASPLTILVPLGYLMGPQSSTAEYAWDYAVWAIEKAGPTFMKFFQWATTRHDLFPAEFINKFTKLQDDTIGHSWKDTKKILEEVLGPNHTQILEFEHATHIRSAAKNDKDNSTSSQKYRQPQEGDSYRPIGSGCIAQVYRARLKTGTSLLPAGTEVAVKVTHPNILHKVCVDFYILNKVFTLLEMIPWLNLDNLSMRDSVSQFRDIMLPQLDLRVEARNLKRFRRDFSGDSKVSFPAPVDELTSSNILVESFIHGAPILDWIREGNSTWDERRDVAKIGFETVMKMIFLHDFVHGDLHPGNILIDRNMQARGKPLRVNMIDCGLVVEMGERDHENLVKILGAFIRKDGIMAGTHMVDTSKKCQGSPLDIELFKKGIQKIIDDDEENNFLESVGDYLADICYMACKYKVKLEASFINAALAVEIMEGIATKLYPDMKVQRIALPMVIKAEMMHGLKGMRLV